MISIKILPLQKKSIFASTNVFCWCFDGWGGGKWVWGEN